MLLVNLDLHGTKDQHMRRLKQMGNQEMKESSEPIGGILGDGTSFGGPL